MAGEGGRYYKTDQSQDGWSLSPVNSVHWAFIKGRERVLYSGVCWPVVSSL